MKIAIIGSGNVGSALANAWRGKHAITFGVRDPASPKHKKQAETAGAQIAAIADGVKAADVVVLATPWPATQEAIKACGSLAGKVVIDCTNPHKPDFSGLELPPAGSAGQQVAQWASGAKVAKAFNTTGAPNMTGKASSHFGALPAMFVAADDAGAKQIALTLAKDAGFDAVDTGPLAMAVSLEHLAMVWIHLAVAQKRGPNFAFALVRKL